MNETKPKKPPILEAAIVFLMVGLVVLLFNPTISIFIGLATVSFLLTVIYNKLWEIADLLKLKK